MIKFEVPHLTRSSTVIPGKSTSCVLLALEIIMYRSEGTKGRNVCLSPG